MPEREGVDAQVRARVDNWRRQLIDLTYRNRLIRYLPTKATSLTVTAPDVKTILADPVRSRPWRVFLPPEPDGGESASDDESSDTAELLGPLVVSGIERTRTPRTDELVVSEPSAKPIVRILDNLGKRSNAEFEDKALRIL